MPIERWKATCPNCKSNPPRNVRPSELEWIRRTDPEAEFYCHACARAKALVCNTGFDQQIIIWNAPGDVCDRALRMERARDARARKTVIAALESRLRQIRKVQLTHGGVL